MLYLNLKRVMHLRGVDNHYKKLLSLGLAPATARYMLGDEVRRISFVHLERLCLALNCTPNDLLRWEPPEKMANAATQSLIKLKRDREEDLAKLLGQLPIDRFEQIIDMLQDLKSKQPDEAI